MFRDYESKTNICDRSIWGAGYDGGSINKFLNEKDIVVIAKLHPLQNEGAIAF